MIIKVNDLKPNTQGIYKINFPNGKIYIGLSVDIKRRIWEHNSPHENKTPCDNAINKYGRITEIEILELVENPNDLNEREIYWIKQYNANNREIGYNLTPGGYMLQGENSGRAVFTDEEVLDIRKRRFYGERRKDVYKDYSNHPLSTFDRVWLGRGYSNIGKEYLIPYNPEYNRKYFSSKANSGTESAKSKLTKEEVLDIRNRFDNLNESITDIWKDYQKVSKVTIRRVVNHETYKNI